jgi:Ca-activated chloride channel family protein
MNFLTPLSFALTILLPVIIAMYLLKLRRSEQMVSSTYLWRRMVRDVEANAPWQRLRRNLLLLLQLLFLLAVILSLARPFTWAQGSGGEATILLVDVSASMAATDVPPSRLETAKNQARLIISNLPEETRATLIAAGESAQVLISTSTDRRLLLQAIEGLQALPVGSDLTGALELASAIAARQPDSEIVVLSDGRASLPERLALPGQVRYIPIGTSGENQAVTLLTLEGSASSENLTAFVQVSNFADAPVTRRLGLYADDQLIDAHDLEIPALGQASVISEIVPPETKIIEATLVEGDFLSLDDRAWAVNRGSNADNQQITLVSPGNRFLETALGLLPGVETTVLNMDGWKSGRLGDANLPTFQPSNLIIFDSAIPTGTLPSDSLFFVGPLASTELFSVTGTIETPIPKPAKEDDPLLAYADLSQITILDAAKIPLPEWARPVIVDETSGLPLLFSGEVAGQRIAVLAFDLRHSDLPLQPAFPILIANLTGTLLPGRVGDIPTQIKTGDTVTFTPLPEIESLKITSPDGTSTQLEIQGGRAVFGDTRQPGVYTVNWEAGPEQSRREGSLQFAVNLANPEESNIQPVENLSLFAEQADAENTPSQQARREWWRLLAWLALLLITAEWLVYNRATLAKLGNQVTQNLKRET